MHSCMLYVNTWCPCPIIQLCSLGIRPQTPIWSGPQTTVGVIELHAPNLVCASLDKMGDDGSEPFHAGYIHNSATIGTYTRPSAEGFTFVFLCLCDLEQQP